jgi:hypothetical protein
MNILDKIYEAIISKKEFRVRCEKCNAIIRGQTTKHCVHNFNEHLKFNHTDEIKVVKEKIENDN